MNNIQYGRKRSGIKKELVAKINDWLDSIENEEVRKAAEQDVIVTGGSIASMLLGEKINDFDLYFRTKATTKLIAQYYVDKFNKAHEVATQDTAPVLPEVKDEWVKNIKGEMEDRVVIHIKSAGVAAEGMSTYKYFETRSAEETEEFAESLQTNTMEEDNTKEKYRPVFLSQNAITLSHKIQLVIRFYGEPDKIHDNYDFVHAMCYYDHAKGDLVMPAEALESLLSRTLVYRGSLYPIASVFRMKKFLERGWRITAGQQLKIMWQISEIDLKDFTVIREQMCGVDQAYLYQVIEAVSHVDPEKINSTYIATIIDRIFEGAE